LGCKKVAAKGVCSRRKRIRKSYAARDPGRATEK